MTLENCKRILEHYNKTGQKERAKEMEAHIKLRNPELEQSAPKVEKEEEQPKLPKKNAKRPQR